MTQARVQTLLGSHDQSGAGIRAQDGAEIVLRAPTVFNIKTVTKIRLILIKIRAWSGAGIGAQSDHDTVALVDRKDTPWSCSIDKQSQSSEQTPPGATHNTA